MTLIKAAGAVLFFFPSWFFFEPFFAAIFFFAILLFPLTKDFFFGLDFTFLLGMFVEK
jgi:hypothetical protein